MTLPVCLSALMLGLDFYLNLSFALTERATLLPVYCLVSYPYLLICDAILLSFSFSPQGSVIFTDSMMAMSR